MASLGQIIFYSMIVLIVLFAALIILILSLAFSNSTSPVTSSNALPIANLGRDVLLSCYIQTESQNAGVRVTSVTWEKTGLKGLVYKYENGAPDLGEQNSNFKGRTQIFPDALVTGNASLLLSAVRRGDEGEYTCTVGSSSGGGTVNIQLRTAAFSAPTFTFSNGSLVAEASRWFPEPNVTWSDLDGQILQGNTNFTENSAGIFSVVSTLQHVSVSKSYNCRIENNLVIATSAVTLTGSEVSGDTKFSFNTASPLLASSYVAMIGVLCIAYLI